MIRLVTLIELNFLDIEFSELIPLLKLGKQLPVEQFEARVSPIRRAHGSPPPGNAPGCWATCAQLKVQVYSLWRWGGTCHVLDVSYETPDITPCRTSPSMPLLYTSRAKRLMEHHVTPHCGGVEDELQCCRRCLRVSSLYRGRVSGTDGMGLHGGISVSPVWFAWARGLCRGLIIYILI